MSQTRRSPVRQQARIPQCDTKGRGKNGNQNDTHIFIPGCIAHEILHNVLCCTCAHTSPSSGSMYWQLRSAAFPWILSVFVPLSLVRKTRCEFPIPRYPWNNDSGCSDRVRHVLNCWSLGRTLIEQQFGPIERRLWRIQYGQCSTCETHDNLCCLLGLVMAASPERT